MVFKMSDLIKYDMNRVSSYLEAKGNKEETKIAMKSFAKNGYKNISFMAFGDS